MIDAHRPGATVSGAAFVPRERTTVSGRLAGDANAPVKIVEFADFQCPFCRRFATDIESLLVKEYVLPAFGGTVYLRTSSSG